MKPKAVVAMSGGVDSSVAAALMKEDGFDVTGIMLKLWKGAAANNESGCCSVEAAEDARRVAQVLDIPFYVLNFADHFSNTVIADFSAEYARGRTPNPCVQCNRSVKFKALLERARSYGATALATGHYARVDHSGELARLRRGRDATKDQSYVLYMLNQAELAMARFPVGEYSKNEIRQIASGLGLRVADKPESQDICFVPNGDSHAFIDSQVPAGSRAGSIVTTGGEKIGEHRGFAHYTVGQRKGLGIGLGVPLYVSHINAADNEVVVGPKEQIQVGSLQLNDISLVAGPPAGRIIEASVMTRYRGPEAAAHVELDGATAVVRFDKPQTKPAPGQAAVFYRSDEVLGGGTICEAS